MTTFEATFYSNSTYGAENVDFGDVLISTMKFDNYYSYKETWKNREIIFCIDTSGSMQSKLDTVKNSLKAFRDLILKDLIFKDDTIFKQFCNIRLITFSDKAIDHWSSSSEQSFTDAVDDISVFGQTNIGDALLMALDRVNPARATWIILLTDGISNKGQYQTLSSFEQFKMLVPQNVRIVPFGYGNDFDASTLEILGDYTYIENDELIAPSMGALAYEYMSTWGFNAAITDDNGIYFNDIIIGKSNIGSLYKDRNYIWACKMYDTPKNICLSYINISPNGLNEQHMNINNINKSSGIVPENIREAFYRHQMGTILTNIYGLGHNGYGSLKQNFSNLYSNIMKIIDKWVEPCAQEYKEDIKRILVNFNNIRNYDDVRRISLSAGAKGITSKTQVSYVDANFQSPMMKEFSNMSLNSSHEY